MLGLAPVADGIHRLHHVLGGERRTDAGHQPGENLRPTDVADFEHRRWQSRHQLAHAAHFAQGKTQGEDDPGVHHQRMQDVGIDNRAHAADADVQHRDNTDDDDRRRPLDAQQGREHCPTAGVDRDRDDRQCADHDHRCGKTYRLAVSAGQRPGNGVLAEVLVLLRQQHGEDHEPDAQGGYVPGGGNAIGVTRLGRTNARGSADELGHHQKTDQHRREVLASCREVFRTLCRASNPETDQRQDHHVDGHDG